MRILFAEDEISLSRAVCAVLKKNNFEVDPVYNGRDALDYITAGEYDGAILDIMMPEMDGISVLKEIRAEGMDIPVIMLTAKGEVDDKVLGLDSGANDYLPKPFDMKELLARLRAMLRTNTAQISSKLNFGNVSLDQTTFEMSTALGSHKLTNKEYQMMEMLISSPRRIFSADTFLEKIWGYESDVDINVVWVYVSYLRKKLTSLGADISIKATRNVGYSLEKNDQSAT